MTNDHSGISFEQSVRRAHAYLGRPVCDPYAQEVLSEARYASKERKSDDELLLRKEVGNKVASLLEGHEGTIRVSSYPSNEAPPTCYDEVLDPDELFGVVGMMMEQVKSVRVATVGDVMHHLEFQVHHEDPDVQKNNRLIYAPFVVTLRRPYIASFAHPIPSHFISSEEAARRLRSIAGCVF